MLPEEEGGVLKVVLPGKGATDLRRKRVCLGKLGVERTSINDLY